ncbi:MAG: hypothetical protein HUJ27_09695 [Rhodobacteraceae bacterium]|nr:hypothetical protein [Paracoccaceae bacterium]
MEWLIWIGAVLSLLGLAGIVWCILAVMKAKRAGLSDEEMRGRLSKVLPVNLGALFLSAIGLMMVVTGVILG